MNTKDIDILNVILIILSLVLAFNIPFGLLIFSYVVLGPLHYLTEINWLKEKKYFVKETKWIAVFVFLVLLISIPVFLKLDIFSNFNKIPAVKKISEFLNDAIDEILILSLVFAIGLIYFKNKIHLSLFLIGSALFSILLLHYFSTYSLMVMILIPTLIHVYFFTLLFMIYGSIKSKTIPGIIAIVLLLLAPLIIIVSKINPSEYYNITTYTKDSFGQSGFGNLNFEISKWFAAKPILGSEFNFLSILGIKIQIFVAFAYIYHYLNWFSKTSIIRWDKALSKAKIITILSIWAISIAIYLYNFKVGLILLSSLSLIHVFLEFPLNITSIKEILIKLKSQFIS